MPIDYRTKEERETRRSYSGGGAGWAVIAFIFSLAACVATVIILVLR